MTGGWRSEETASGGRRRRNWMSNQYQFQDMGLQGHTRFSSFLGAGNFDINKVDFKLLFGLNSD